MFLEVPAGVLVLTENHYKIFVVVNGVPGVFVVFMVI